MCEQQDQSSEMFPHDKPTAKALMHPVGCIMNSSETLSNVKNRWRDAVPGYGVVMHGDEVMSVMKSENLGDLCRVADSHGSEFVGNLRGEEFRTCRSTDTVAHIMRIFAASSVNLLVVMDVPGRVDGIIERGDVG